MVSLEIYRCGVEVYLDIYKMDLFSTGQQIVLLWSICGLNEVYGNNSTSSSSTIENGGAFPKIASTLVIVIGAVAIAVILAKVADMCYDRAVIRDDSSDISVHTKSLIRARLAIIQMKKKEKKKNAKRFFKLWSSKPNSKADSASSVERGVVINVEEAKNNGIMTIESWEKPVNGLSSSPNLLQKLTNGSLDKPDNEIENMDENNGNIAPSSKGTTINVSPKTENIQNNKIKINTNKIKKTDVKKKTDSSDDTKKGRSVTFKDDLEIESMRSKF